MVKYNIEHNLTKGRIEAFSEGNLIGVTDYDLLSDHTLTITHTEVNSEYEGNGIAASMTKFLLEWAISSQLKVIPVCSYTRTYIMRHPEYHCLLES